MLNGEWLLREGKAKSQQEIQATGRNGGQTWKLGARKFLESTGLERVTTLLRRAR